MVENLEAVGTQLAAGDVSTPLLASDPAWLSAPVSDPLVFGLCAKVCVNSEHWRRSNEEAIS